MRSLEVGIFSFFYSQLLAHDWHLASNKVVFVEWTKDGDINVSSMDFPVLPYTWKHVNPLPHMKMDEVRLRVGLTPWPRKEAYKWHHPLQVPSHQPFPLCQMGYTPGSWKYMCHEGVQITLLGIKINLSWQYLTPWSHFSTWKQNFPKEFSCHKSPPQKQQGKADSHHYTQTLSKSCISHVFS